MSETRRSFLKAGSALATAVSATAGPSVEPAASVQVPKMKFGNAEISRLVLGTNPFYGYSHYSPNLDYSMREWYTPARIHEIMRRCSQYGINAFNYVNLGRSTQDFQQFVDAGGKLHLVAQIIGDPTPTWKQFRPLAMYNQGEEVDKAFRNGAME